MLRRVKAVARAPQPRGTTPPEPQELRGRLFAAVRELVARLADRKPLVLVIDDLQWGDPDSLALLGAVLRPPDAPAVLVVATVREGINASLLEIWSPLAPGLQRVRLGPLPPAEARELAAALLAQTGSAGTSAAEAIAAEAAGHPLFIDQLVRHLVPGGEATASSLRLDDVLRRARVALRGYGFRPRDESLVPTEQLQRIDFCSWVAAALGPVDFIRGYDLNARALLMALAAGEPNRLVRALANEAVFQAAAGTGARRRVEALVELAGRAPLADVRPAARAALEVAVGMAEYFMGQARRAHDHLVEAERILTGEGEGLAWELDAARLYQMFALAQLGRIAELSRRAPRLAAEALDRGDLFASTNLRLGVLNQAWLVGGDVEHARRIALDAASSPAAGPLVRLCLFPGVVLQLDLYEGAGEAARARPPARGGRRSRATPAATPCGSRCGRTRAGRGTRCASRRVAPRRGGMGPPRRSGRAGAARGPRGRGGTIGVSSCAAAREGKHHEAARRSR